MGLTSKYIVYWAPNLFERFISQPSPPNIGALTLAYNNKNTVLFFKKEKLKQQSELNNVLNLNIKTGNTQAIIQTHKNISSWLSLINCLFRVMGYI